nr:uncharacterized protein LOC124810039 [Hydra vulgaris]
MVDRLIKDFKIDEKKGLEAQKFKFRNNNLTADQAKMDFCLPNSITRDHRMMLAIVSAGNQVVCNERKKKARFKLEHIFQTFKINDNQKLSEQDLAKDSYELINSCPLIKGENNGQRRYSMAERWKNDRMLVYHACKNYSQLELVDNNIKTIEK